MDTGRRHETPGLETKDSLIFIAIVVTRVSSFFVLVPKARFPQGRQTGPDATSTHIGCVTGEKPEFRKPQSFVMGSKQTCQLYSGNILSLL